MSEPFPQTRSIRRQQQSGQWMAEELGRPRRRQHFVLTSAPLQRGRDDWPVGYLAECGTMSIPASEQYLATMKVCSTCQSFQVGE